MTQQEQTQKVHYTINGVTATIGDMMTLKMRMQQGKNQVKYIGILETLELKNIDIVTD
jgi:hypothetical protein